MNKGYIVTQSNKLIQAKHNHPLTTREQKIILTMVSMIEPSDQDFKEYRISVKEFTKLLGLKESKYSQIKEITKKLMSKTIEIPQDDGGWLLSHWVSSVKYIKGEGIVELYFSPDLKPYMLQLKNQFTSYQLSNILSLQSSYSIRLYELLKQWQYLGKWESDLDELKLQFGIQDGTYKRYNHFKTRVLKKAVDELNYETDLKIKFEEIKKGRSVVKIKFHINQNANKEIKLKETHSENEKTQERSENIRERLNALVSSSKYQFDKTYFKQMHDAASFIFKEDAEKELTMLIQYVNGESSINNPLGFIKSRLKSAWEDHVNGEEITFANLKPTQQRNEEPYQNDTAIPDWFKKRNEPAANIPPSDDIEERREKLRKELEELEKRKK